MKTYDVQELVEIERGPLWIVNCSNESLEDGRGGDVFISISVNGNTRQLKVPLSWLPMNVTLHYPRKTVLESVNFTEAINKGLIQAISVEDATRLLNRNGADEERARLVDRDQAVREAINNRGLSRNTVVVNSSDDVPEEVAVASKAKKITVTRIDSDDDDTAEADQKHSEVQPRFKAWILKINGLTFKEALSDFQSRGSLTEPNARYLVDQCTHPKIVKIVKDQL